MKISNALHLSHAQFAHYKRRNLATVIIVGTLFSVILSVNCILQGLENTFLSTASQLTDSTIYLQITPPTDNCQIIFPENASSYLDCPSFNTQPIISTIEQYHGQFLGPINNALLASTAQPFIRLDPSTAPDDTIPAIISYNQALHYLNMTRTPLTYTQVSDVYQSTLGQVYTTNSQSYYIVGISPSSNIRTPPNSLNPLDFALTITTTSGLTPNFIPLNLQFTPTPSISYLASFSSLDDAYAYISFERCNYNESSLCHSYSIDELYTNRLALRQIFRIDRFILSFPTYILIFVAILITFLTLLKITYQSSQTITLYCAFGASLPDICLIFCFYFLEVCFFALIFALSLSLLTGLIASFFNAPHLSDLLSASYGVPISTFSLLIGWNWSILATLLIIFIAVPFAFIFTIPRLANPNTTKLKQ